MPTKTGKTYSSFYGNDLAVDQSGNTGVDTVLVLYRMVLEIILPYLFLTIN